MFQRSIPTPRLLLSLVVIGGLVGLVQSRGYSFPEPKIVPSTWQLDFEFKMPRLIVVEPTSGGGLRYFWYLPYTVTNNTGDERVYVPSVTVMDSSGRIVAAGQEIDPAVFKAVTDHQRNVLLESPIDVVGTILVGQDNARDSVFYWPATTRDVDHIMVFISGLSGETAVTTNPDTGEQLLLKKALMLTFQTPGDFAHTLTKPVQLLEQQWVMR